MSLRIEIDINKDNQLADLRGRVLDKEGLHARIAGTAEAWVKGPEIAGRNSAEQHRTASKLGATPTGHLADAYDGIGSESDATSARLVIPDRTRLTAAFGKQVLTPTRSKFLTIPTHKDSYGRRAGEMEDLFVIARPGKALMLARRNESINDSNSKLALRARPNQRRKTRDKNAGIEVMYLLLKEVEIPEDKTLIPLDKLETVAEVAADNFINDAIEEAQNS